MRHFLTALLREEKVISEQMQHIAPMIFTEVEKVAFDQACICHICEKPLERVCALVPAIYRNFQPQIEIGRAHV